MERWQNRVAVVTGASSGIGAALSKALVRAGLMVVGLARRVELIEALKGELLPDQQGRLFAVQCDVTSENSVTQAFDWIVEKLGGVDIMVNNAGILRQGRLCTMSPAAVREVLDTNVLGVVLCTQRAFRSMKERGFDGHVLFMNSIGGHTVPRYSSMFDLNVYSPTKFALTALTEIYRQEFRHLGTNIKVTSISPGLVNTAMVPPEALEMFKECILSPEDVSSSVLQAIATPPHVQVHELVIKPIGEIS